MEITLAQKAISLALSGDWEEAVNVNLQILAENPKDIDALNRLARAYAELGKVGKAKETAEKVLEIEPFNSIAKKCLDKWKAAGSVAKNGSTPPTPPEAFLEESGKTKLITLVNPGDSKVIAALDSGEEVKISSYSHKVSVVTKDDKYIGRLPDDIAARLRNLIKAGTKYQVLVKSIKPKEVTVFIRETEKGEGAPDIASFPTEKIEYVSFTPPELVHEDEPEPPTDEPPEE